MKQLFYAAVLVCILAAAQGARAAENSACRLALVLGLDISGSVDWDEYRLQMDGLANALLSPDVQRALFSLPHAPVSLAIFEWGGPGQQKLLVDWTEITRPDQLDAIAARLRATTNKYFDPSTAIGDAMIFGAELLRERDHCWQRTLDISGDGPANTGLDPSLVPEAILEGITINGLVVTPDARANTTKNLRNVKTLRQYYETEIIRGVTSFVEAADDFRDFERAMIRKLTREIENMVLSQTGAPPLPPGAPLP